MVLRRKRKEFQDLMVVVHGGEIEPEDKADVQFADVERRVKARLKGVSEDQLDFADLGIAVITEEGA